MSLRLGILGCGAHCSAFHVPALVDWMASHPGEAELVALCDRDDARLAAVQAQLGGERIDDWQRMLDMGLDGLLAITPPAFTPQVVRACARQGLPVLMEKPLAVDLASAEQLVADIGDAPHMVSMNRRFDPALLRGRAWLGERRIGQVRATFARVARREPQFIEETGIHIVDAVSSLIGPPRFVGGDRWQQGGIHHAHLRVEGSCTALIDIWPGGGIDQECIECTGEGWRLELRSGWFDTGIVRAWEGKELVLDEQVDPGLPQWRRAGCDAETDHFLRALRGDGALAPRAAEVLPAARACAAVAAMKDCMQQ